MPTVTITTAVEDQDVDVIHRFLSEESAWAKGISRPLVQESVRNSLNFGLFVANAQVGYARVISDYATFAYLLDVFVLREYRGRGYSRQLMNAVVAHPGLQGLRRFLLVSSTARGLYQKYGFAPLAKPETFMEINVPNAYQDAA
ncbi:GNAT family N-acetyltransferase [Piscinibacter sp. XHJ-5]|uniref:GNAT family N-acetyltransferase n=1 Tax=Piscinibacter sp. XHJ-5 TaxID=3037797 RepID=UPI0024532504|nr:GNAT family N-acetyltransferase [Piscinibacter sp. XHJ-5]